MKVFVISMKNSTDRRLKVEQALANVSFEFFDADNLSDNSEHFIFSLYSPEKTKKYKGYELTVPELGCFASHISLWRKCVELGESILILEDNIEVVSELPEYLDKVHELSDKYGILKIYNLFKSNYKVFEEVEGKYKVVSNLKKSGLGTQAYAISPRVAQIYLNIVPGFFEPVDNFMEHEWRTKQTVYSLIPYLVQRGPVNSTIGKRKLKNGMSAWSKVMPELYRSYITIRRAMYNKLFK
ncbi:glycosyltransferase family 25 protein [Paenalcaligenes niemegkensis]|uniref:glycosyltransferase family 25 protein n=1 Tax=Paenalcaligenes niemegkensis TaxID=2895469 RepID=UPI001EE7FB59|nr:glycosyltransferase family 25 protein [Paenalcaligenes niemegkensis]MCQ9618267.1 glycosyltransferase family 25 protein [Paenalcaligenes niemegkensis]